MHFFPKECEFPIKIFKIWFEFAPFCILSPIMCNRQNYQSNIIFVIILNTEEDLAKMFQQN